MVKEAYTVILTVIDGEGNTDTYSKIIIVEKSEEDDGGGIPRFEFIFLLGAMIAFIFLTRKYKIEST